MPVMITSSVGGKPSQNNPNDVKKIQALLTQVRCGPRPGQQVAVIGVCGQDTIEAIRRFQSFFPGAGADGRVDPGGKTRRHLDELAEPLKLGAIDDGSG